MKHRHVTGTRRERKARHSTIDRYRAMGEAIAKQLAGKTVEELLNRTHK
jgi:hypothetical protein